MTPHVSTRSMMCAAIFLACALMPVQTYGQNSSPNPGTANTPCPVTTAAASPGTAGPAEVTKAKTNIPTGARALSFDLHFDSGWVFNLPGAQAVVVTPSVSAFSPVETVHVAPSAGATFWITRWLGAYGDFVGIDGGSAQISVGGLTSSVTDNLFGAYFGAQFQYPRSWVRPYLDVGGGVLHESAKGTIFGEQIQGSATVGSIRIGGGARMMISKRWGVKFAAEGYHFSANGVSRTYPRIGAGWFFQTKPSGTGR